MPSSISLSLITVFYFFLFATVGNAKTLNQLSAEIALDSAEELGSDLAAALDQEKSKVVFLDILKCDPGSAWCEVFSGRLHSELSGSRIKFLTDDVAQRVREKVAKEQVYQQSSQMVDIEKAVEVGKQDAFHAFITIEVSGKLDDGVINIKTQSVKILEASTTISLFHMINISKSHSKSWSQIFTGFIFTGIGTAGALRANEMAYYHKDKGDEAYKNYGTAEDTANAKKSRKEVERHDNGVKMSRMGAVAGWSVAATGLLVLMSDGNETLKFKVESAEEKSRTNTLWANSGPDLMLSNSYLSLGWSFNF